MYQSLDKRSGRALLVQPAYKQLVSASTSTATYESVINIFFSMFYSLCFKAWPVRILLFVASLPLAARRSQQRERHLPADIGAARALASIVLSENGIAIIGFARQAAGAVARVPPAAA